MAGSGADSVRRLLAEVWGEGNLSVLGDLVTEDIVVHLASNPEPVTGVESYREFAAACIAVLGEARFEIEEQIVDGDRVATRWRAFPGADASGGGVIGINMAHCAADGRVRESWDTYDLLSVAAAAAEPDGFEKLALRL